MSDLLIVLYEKLEHEGQIHMFPLCAIVRTTDGEQAYDKALELADLAEIVEGHYEGMPAHEYNGAGQFAKGLLSAVDAGWEMYTTLIPPGDSDADDVETWMSEYDLSLAIYVPSTSGKVTHSAYTL